MRLQCSALDPAACHDLEQEMTVARSAFRALYRQIKRFDADGIPCTGVVGRSQYTGIVWPLHTLRDEYRTSNNQPGGLDSEGSIPHVPPATLRKLPG